MKQILITAIFGFICSTTVSGQSTISKTLVRDIHKNEMAQVFRITSLKEITDSSKFVKASRQFNIIGNDFYGEEEIGKAYANNKFYERSDYVPIDGFKRTLCGLGVEYGFHSGRIDDDLCIYIEDPVLPCCSDYIRSFGKFFESSINIVEGEVDIHDRMHAFYAKPYPIPQVSRDRGLRQSSSRMCLYGAWVVERGSLLKPNNHEVHPLEQWWWADDRSQYDNNTITYYLNLAIDNSGRFESEGDFDGHLIKPWGKSPLNGVFAIEFEINRKRKEKQIYNINKISDLNAGPSLSDPKIHYLVLDNDTLVSVYENIGTEMVNVEFVEVGTPSPSNQNDIVKGVLLIKSNIKKTANDYAGSLRLSVQKKSESSIVNFYSVSIEKIKRLENNSFRYHDESTNKTYTSPTPVPASFNEKKVYIEVTGPGKVKRKMSTSIAKGQEQEVSNFNFSTKASLVNYLQLYVRFYTDSSKLLTLGESGMVSNPPLNGLEETWNESILESQIRSATLKLRNPNNPNEDDDTNESSFIIVTTQMFRVYFKVKVTPVAVGNSKTN